MDVCAEVCCMELAQEKQLLFCGLCTGTVLIYPLAFPQETLCLPPPESLPTVRSMAISPREDKIAVAYEDTVCLFEITTRDSFPCVEGPIHNYSLSLLHSPVSAMALLPDCRLLYGTFGGEVAIYDFKSATTAELDQHGAAITCIALSNWDKHALVGSEDCVQKLWNMSPVLLDHTMEYKVVKQSQIVTLKKVFNLHLLQEHYRYIRNCTLFIYNSDSACVSISLHRVSISRAFCVQRSL